MSRTTVLGCLCRAPLRRIAGSTALAVTMIFAGSIASAGAACPSESAVPTQLSIQEARDSLTCLINEERAINGLSLLTVNISLQQAAQHHSKAMNKRSFFGHRSMLKRIRRAGYARGASAWRVGEVIGWGKGESGSPKSIVSAWMQSQAHRETLLLPAFHEMGVGVVKGSPRSRKRRSGAAIYTVDFGSRG